MTNWAKAGRVLAAHEAERALATRNAVLVDGHDGFTWAQDETGEPFTTESARELAERWNARMKPQHQRFRVYALVPVEPQPGTVPSLPPGQVVITAGTCEVLLTDAGFYARCTTCPRVSGEIVHARFKAREWATAHDCQRAG